MTVKWVEAEVIDFGMECKKIYKKKMNIRAIIQIHAKIYITGRRYREIFSVVTLFSLQLKVRAGQLVESCSDRHNLRSTISILTYPIPNDRDINVYIEPEIV